MNSNKEILKTLSPNTFPVVGIGASAGGLDAFKKLIKAIPEDSGMAYVLVQHLDPTHNSILPALLQKITKIPVLEISDEIKVRPNHIYIIPSNKMLVANDGVLQLSPRPTKNKKELNLPIDLFFTSLAEVHQEDAIGVVLSGTASDGTAGLRAIKEHGGITFAQDEASAAYGGMPHSAIQAGVVDFILSPAEIPNKLSEIMLQLNSSEADMKNVPQEEHEVFKQILFLLRIRKGTDFTYYKRPTILRRIIRRMAINKSESPNAYLNYLKENREEQDILYQDLLIPVTAFFRDRTVFDNLCASVFPHILKNKVGIGPIRVWVAGCSTGQEAYSMAMCLMEFIGHSQQKAQIFATDISAPAIAKARRGVYTKSEVTGVAAYRLQEFFTKTDEGYRIDKEVRDMCVFAVHNFLKDPPFGKIDFVSCRNVLIYLEPYLQKKALTTFHYSINPKGFLLLGKSETNSTVPTLFDSADKQDKLFTRKDGPGKYMHVASLISEQNMHDLNANFKAQNVQTNFQKTADDIILSRYTPAGVVINEAMDIVHFRGATDDFLVQSPGKPTHNLLKMARSGLAFELRNIIRKLKKENATIIKENIPMQVGGIQHIITIEAVPIPDMVEPHYLIIFFETPNTKLQNKVSDTPNLLPDEKDLQNLYLTKELAQNREDMHSITEDQEAANEELQSTNEELLSSSEELQSLNEELEASKEEMQSSNEELTVLNQELTSLNEQLNTSNAYQHLLQKKMEAQAKMTEDLLMTAPGFICTMRGPDHIYEMVNDRYQQLFGKRIIKDKPILVALPELIGQGFDKLLDKVYNSGEPYVGIEIPITLARDEGLDPERRFFNFSYQPMYDENKIIYSILVFGYEVTDQINAREKMAEIQNIHAKELEEKVQQRTMELNEANELLIQKNVELESFNYISSHDLQEPLRKIQIYSDLILDKENAFLSDKGKHNFQRIQNASRKMQTLIEDLLAYSRANVNERVFEKADLNKIIDEVKNDLADTILDKKAIIEVTGFCEADVNFFQFRQVINNLIANALKFSKPGIIPIITIKSEIGDGKQFQNENPALSDGKLFANEKYCHITFSDNGIGFEQQYQDKIFVVFQRLHGKEKYAGTGIGLAIIKKIIENHNGAITASSELNMGATFDIYIPAF